MSSGQPTRRERYRQQTIDEIRSLARAQVAEGGESAISLNAIARTMSTSPAALYRYFDNRDDLVADLVVDAYRDLARHLEDTAAAADPAVRLRVVCVAYREWALASPNSYRLIFETASGSGLVLAADRVRPAAQRSMDVFLDALAGAGLPEDPMEDALAADLTTWGERAERPELSAAVLHRGLTVWTRLHGLVSLEIGQHLAATGVSPALLFDAELGRLLPGLDT